MKHTENIVTAVLWIGVLLIGSVLFFVLPRETVSLSERRTLAVLPEATAENWLNGRYEEALEPYVEDHFPFREELRRLKAGFLTAVLRQTESDGIAIRNGELCALQTEIHEDSLWHAAGCIRAVYERYLSKSKKIGLAIVPDKGYYWGREGYPVMDYAAFTEELVGNVPEMTYIDLFGCLDAASYHPTDSHWKQEALGPTVDRILQGLGNRSAGAVPVSSLQEKTIYPFYGVYAAQAAIGTPPDTLRYYDGGPLSNVKAFDFETRTGIPLYDEENYDRRDPYTVFLGGAKGLLRIENPDAASEEELVIFRDSYASALAPLLAPYYRSITLVDTRYVHPDLLGRYIDFSGKTVLFLYSTLLLNESGALR